MLIDFLTQDAMEWHIEFLTQQLEKDREWLGEEATLNSLKNLKRAKEMLAKKCQVDKKSLYTVLGLLSMWINDNLGRSPIKMISNVSDCECGCCEGE